MNAMIFKISLDNEDPPGHGGDDDPPGPKK